MNTILLADKAFISTRMTPKQTAKHLQNISTKYHYAFNPLQTHKMGNAERSIFKILIENHIYRIVWHNDTLISVWVSEYGFDNEVKHWPQDDN